MVELKHDDHPAHRPIFLGGNSRQSDRQRRPANSLLWQIAEAVRIFIVRLFR